MAAFGSEGDFFCTVDDAAGGLAAEGAGFPRPAPGSNEWSRLVDTPPPFPLPPGTALKPFVPAGVDHGVNIDHGREGGFSPLQLHHLAQKPASASAKDCSCKAHTSLETLLHPTRCASHACASPWWPTLQHFYVLCRFDAAETTLLHISRCLPLAGESILCQVLLPGR